VFVARSQILRCAQDDVTKNPDTTQKPMTQAAKRSVLRWIHLIFSVPIIGYVYSPFENIPQYAAPTRYVFLPALALSGFWMWKGHAVRRLVSKRSPAVVDA
jgi:hypothetical protein